MPMDIEFLISQEIKSCSHNPHNEYGLGLSDLYIVDKILNSKKQKQN